MLGIWGRPTSICTQRVLWACAELDLEFDLTLASATMGQQGHVSQGHIPYGVVDTADYRAMNPNSTVPVIKDGDYNVVGIQFNRRIPRSSLRPLSTLPKRYTGLCPS